MKGKRRRHPAFLGAAGFGRVTEDVLDARQRSLDLLLVTRVNQAKQRPLPVIMTTVKVRQDIPDVVHFLFLRDRRRRRGGGIAGLYPPTTASKYRSPAIPTAFSTAIALLRVCAPGFRCQTEHQTISQSMAINPPHRSGRVPRGGSTSESTWQYCSPREDNRLPCRCARDRVSWWYRLAARQNASSKSDRG